MRRARPLILLAILLVLAGLGATYYFRVQQQARNAPAKPAQLPQGTLLTSHEWTYTHTSNQKTVVKVHANDLREVAGKQYLSGVALDIQNKNGKEYDHVTSAKAEADLNAGVLYSDGDVEITMKVPVGEDPTPGGKLMGIKTSGVRVEIKTGKSSTDRLATFQFDRGEGKAVGADYDPSTRELLMRSQVDLLWRGSNPKSAPMRIEAGQVSYNERDSRVSVPPSGESFERRFQIEPAPYLEVVPGSRAVRCLRALRQVDFAAKHGVVFDSQPQCLHIALNHAARSQFHTAAGHDVTPQTPQNQHFLRG